MKIIPLILWLLFFATLSQAQSGESSQQKEPQVSAVPASNIVPLPSSKSLTATQFAGKKLFGLSFAGTSFLHSLRPTARWQDCGSARRCGHPRTNNEWLRQDAGMAI